MAIRRGLSCSEATMSLTTSYAVAAVLGSAAVDSRAKAVPDECLLSWMHGTIVSIASSATTVTWFLAADEAGDIPLTDAKTTTIVVGRTTPTKGGIAVALDLEYVRSSAGVAGVAGSLYVIAKTNTGTCTLTPRLYWREDL